MKFATILDELVVFSLAFIEINNPTFTLYSRLGPLHSRFILG